MGNFKIKQLGRKAQIATTFTWIIAMFIIVFMIILFFAGVAMLLGLKVFPFVSSIFWGSKSVGLSDELTSPSGYDPGDLELQRSAMVFLSQWHEYKDKNVSSLYLLANLDKSIYEKDSQLSESEIAESEAYKTFYESSKSFFGELYDECYVVCLEFRTLGDEQLIGKQVLVGKNCNAGSYDCYVSSANIRGDFFNYAKVDTYLRDDIFVEMKLLKGALGPILQIY